VCIVVWLDDDLGLHSVGVLEVRGLHSLICCCQLRSECCLRALFVFDFDNLGLQAQRGSAGGERRAQPGTQLPVKNRVLRVFIVVWVQPIG
jgi:hypothetical protein